MKLVVKIAGNCNITRKNKFIIYLKWINRKFDKYIKDKNEKKIEIRS